MNRACLDLRIKKYSSNNFQIMKNILFVVLFILTGAAVHAKMGYKIKVEFKEDIPDTTIYLAKYFAKPPPTIYKIDSAKVINKRTATFETKDSILGGIYMVLFNNNSKFAEVIVDNGLNTTMTITPSTLPIGITFTNSAENEHYVTYQASAEKYGKLFQELNKRFEKAKTEKDSSDIRKEYKKVNDEFKEIRMNFIDKYPKSFIASVFNAIIVPDAPEGKHYLPDGKTEDSLFAFRYIHDHYWDKFNFNDNRLIHTPLLDGKLNDYFTNYVIPIPDTFNHEASILLEKMRPSKELFKYTLHFLAGYTERNKVMGMDESFVYLVENYYAKGDAYWLDSAQVAKYIDRAQKISPNIIGAPAPELDLAELFTLQRMNIGSVKAPYTVLAFYDPHCGHCKIEMPELDSVYNASLKAKGVKVIALGIDSTLSNIRDFVTKNHMEDFINVIEPNKNTFKAKYDVYSTPKFYLLDENKIIQGKGLKPTNIIDVINMLERRKKKQAEDGYPKG